MYLSCSTKNSIAKAYGLRSYKNQLTYFEDYGKENSHGANVTIGPMCGLCETSNESIDHTFFKCDYSNWIIKEGTKAVGDLIHGANVAYFDKLLTSIDETKKGSKIWDLLWSITESIVWHT